MSLRDHSSFPEGWRECSVDGCAAPVESKGERRRHYRATLARDVRCSGCGTPLLEVAELCGFCMVEGSPELLAAWESGAIVERAA
jgi:hypothetical protein